MTISVRRYQAAAGARFLHSPGQLLLPALKALHVVCMTLAAAILSNQLFQALGCGESFSCFHQQDVLLLLMAILSIWLVVHGLGLLPKTLQQAFVAIEIGWAALFTWYGWFSMESPLRPHELHLGRDDSGLTATKLLILYTPRFGVYVGLLAIGCYPLLAGCRARMWVHSGDKKVSYPRVRLSTEKKQ